MIGQRCFLRVYICTFCRCMVENKYLIDFMARRCFGRAFDARTRKRPHRGKVLKFLSFSSLCCTQSQRKNTSITNSLFGIQESFQFTKMFKIICRAMLFARHAFRKRGNGLKYLFGTSRKYDLNIWALTQFHGFKFTETMRIVYQRISTKFEIFLRMIARVISRVGVSWCWALGG